MSARGEALVKSEPKEAQGSVNLNVGSPSTKAVPSSEWTPTDLLFQPR